MDDVEIEGLVRAACDAAGRAYCPYSEYRVGAALLTISGDLFCGCNVENASYGLTVCAERVALQAAVAAGFREFSAVAVVVSGAEPVFPCGACRQVLAEFCGADVHVFAATLESPDRWEETDFGSLLPHAFRLRST